MMRILLLAFLSLSFITNVTAQDHGFPFGKVTYRELDTKYELDTATAALVIDEFGESYIDNSNNNNLLLEYHVKIKILTKAGLKYADVEIPLYKSNSKVETVHGVEASSFTLDGGSMRETKLEQKNIFTENSSKFWDVKKFAIPNVRVGSIIEFRYTLESPYIFNWRSWEFQSEIPKQHSEYWATIPGNYHYNISLKGFLKLSKNESELVRECFTPGGGNKADCGRYKWGMKDIPAFLEEDYMTAKKNFLSAVNFELSEIEYFDGRKDKITKEWKDAEQELKRDEKFGIQIRKGKDIMDSHVDVLTAGETDPLQKAQRIYNFVKEWYRWDDTFGFTSEFGIKKAFDKKLGNVGDINLSLIAALKYAELDVEPLILSTRSNGFPTDLHPVLSDFNYVVAKLNINDKVYLLDAVDDFLPFGLIAERCLNGRGRVFGEKESYWYDLRPADKARQVSFISLKLDKSGEFTGTLQFTFAGYEGVRERKRLSGFSSEKDYINAFNEKLRSVEIKKYTIENADDLKKSLVVKLDVAIEGYDDLSASHFLFNPFMFDRWKENPFKSSERLYPVDFGPPLEEVVIFSLEYPEEFAVTDLPEKVGLALPSAGGRYIFDIQNTGNKISLNSSLLIARTIYTSEEYHFLKELFSRVVSIQQTDLVFKRK